MIEEDKGFKVGFTGMPISINQNNLPKCPICFKFGNIWVLDAFFCGVHAIQAVELLTRKNFKVEELFKENGNEKLSKV